MTTRLAVVLAVAFLAAGAWFTFGHTSSSQGFDCGSWASPSYTSATAEAAQESTLSRGIADAISECDQSRGQHRTWALLMLLCAVLVPAAVLFVGAGRRRDEIPVS